MAPSSQHRVIPLMHGQARTAAIAYLEALAADFSLPVSPCSYASLRITSINGQPLPDGSFTNGSGSSADDGTAMLADYLQARHVTELLVREPYLDIGEADLPAHLIDGDIYYLYSGVRLLKQTLITAVAENCVPWLFFALAHLRQGNTMMIVGAYDGEGFLIFEEDADSK
ncbi:hypothetical protein [Vogesella mureinivorans]|uniref:hypothetical protein n=1 Tax=Vogesella mureinivorans TaxID=657276 RepID=UPI0011C75682|nr:hypothetical protein [Vogesella mureinivorans]